MEINTLKTAFRFQTVTKVAHRRETMVEDDWSESWWRLFRACGCAVVSYPVIGVFRARGGRVAGRPNRNLAGWTRARFFPTKDELVPAIPVCNDGNMRASNVHSSRPPDGIHVIRPGGGRARAVVLVDQRSAETED